MVDSTSTGWTGVQLISGTNGNILLHSCDCSHAFVAVHNNAEIRLKNGNKDIRLHSIKNKQAENGLQLRSSENGSAALWIKIAVILSWR